MDYVMLFFIALIFIGILYLKFHKMKGISWEEQIKQTEQQRQKLIEQRQQQEIQAKANDEHRQQQIINEQIQQQHREIRTKAGDENASLQPIQRKIVKEDNYQAFKTDSPRYHSDQNLSLYVTDTNLDQDLISFAAWIPEIEALDKVGIDEILNKICSTRRERKKLLEQIKINPWMEGEIRAEIKKELYRRHREGN